MSHKAIVLDANILIRAILGKHVRELIAEHAPAVRFFAPDVAFTDTRKYLPALLEKRGIPCEAAMRLLDSLGSIVHAIDADIDVDMKEPAPQRIAQRDADDWPVLASAMTMGCPVWTEDADFFGTGVSTWTTDRVALYFE